MMKFRWTPTQSIRPQFESLERRLLLAASSLGEEFRVNDLVIRKQSIVDSSTAVVSTAVNSVVVYEGKGRVDRDGVFAEVLDAAGGTITASFRVNSTRRGEQHSPAVGADANGNFVVAWAGRGFDLDRGVGDKRGVFVQRFDATGAAVGNETLVNETIGGAQVEPAIAVAANGSFTVTWSGVGAGDVSGVFMQRFGDNGERLGGEVLVNTEIDDEQAASAVAFAGTGSFVVAWSSRHQDGSDWGVFAQRFGALGNRIGGEFRVNTTNALSQSAPVLASNPLGGVYVAWQSFGQDGDSWSVVGRSFNEAGQPSPAELVLNDSPAGHQQAPSVAVDASGQVLAAWMTANPNGDGAIGAGWEVAARSLNADGTFDGGSFAVNRAAAGANSGHQLAPSVAVSGGSAVIAWSGNGATDRDGVFAQRFETDDDGPQVDPVLQSVAMQFGVVDVPFTIDVTATDDNFNDTLRIQLDPDDAPPLAELTQEPGTRTATISYMPVPADAGMTLLFRVNVSDNGDPPGADSIDFFLTVAAAPVPATEATGIEAAAIDAALSELA